jgi:Zn ribbon nucleic-acid-binding protein
MRSKTDKYPLRVSRDEQPEQTPENMPAEIVQRAVSIATTYGACPQCETEQWIPTVAGMNTHHDCSECGFEMRVVG